jgi:SAM-dependent methyltransferase
MSDLAALVREHYESTDDDTGFPERVQRILDGMPPGPLSPADLGAFDQFHVGGPPATAAFIQLLGLRPGMQVLDAGCGFGGPARQVAAMCGCEMTGVDLAPAFIGVANALADRSGLRDRVSYQAGDLLHLPFPDARFDAVYTQHVVMNISDRAGLYAELRRVLKPGGTFGFHDILAVEGASPPMYPVPWAETSEISTLLTEPETRAVLLAAALPVQLWHDVTTDAIAAARQMRPGVGNTPTLASLLGKRFVERFGVLRQNLEDGRLRIVMATCTAQ